MCFIVMNGDAGERNGPVSQETLQSLTSNYVPHGPAYNNGPFPSQCVPKWPQSRHKNPQRPMKSLTWLHEKNEWISERQDAIITSSVFFFFFFALYFEVR